MSASQPVLDGDRPILLEAQGITKRFGPVSALINVSLQVRGGEVLGLIGDNGAGKSTLIKVMCGALRPDAGVIVVDGVPRSFNDPLDARRAGIETVFQDLALVPTLNIAENIYLGRELCSGGLARWLRYLDKRSMRRETESGFQRLGVTLPPARTKVIALSGGQRQQVAITRAVVWGSHILLMDEPSAALGVRQTELVLSLVERLKSHGVAVVFISHNMEQVLRVADRIAVMRLGHKVAEVEVDGTKTGADLVGLMTGAIAHGAASSNRAY